MKPVQRWMCDYCHTTFASEEECQNCESKHVDVKTTSPEYENGEKYPHRITVRFKDGSVHYYLDKDYIWI